MIDFSPLWISLRIATVSTAITFCLGVVTAHFMARYRGRWRSLIDSIFLAPLVLPPTVLGFLLLLLFSQQGVLGRLTGWNIVFTTTAAVITATVVAFPLMYKTVLAAFKQIDGSLEQAARTLGASDLRVFLQVTLPLALPGLIAGTTLAFARALGEFGATLMLAGNIPGKTQTLPMAIYFAVEAGDFQSAAVWTVVILLITLGGLALVNCWQLSPRSFLWQPDKFLFWIRQRVPSRHTDIDTRSCLASISRFTRTSHLSVALVKRLPGFTLNVAFSTDSQPLGLLGSSGAGKSLILRCIAGIETPDEGRIVLNGRVLFDSELGINVPSCDRNVGIVFQNYALFPHLTVTENLAFGLPNRLRPHQQQIVREQLACMHLQGMENRYPVALSGGQQQRVALARALLSQPEVLLLDEPFSALDTHLRHQLEQELRHRLSQFSGVTLFVTHNIEEAYRVSHNLLVMDQGQISAHAEKAAVLEHPKTTSAARLTGCKNVSRAVQVGSTTVQALDWDCTLSIAHPIPPKLTYIGMRAHQFGFLETLPASFKQTAHTRNASEMSSLINVDVLEPEAIQVLTAAAAEAHLPPNTFTCWLTTTSETPHRMTLFLKLNTLPLSKQDYHLQAEVFKDKWAVLKSLPQPWAVHLDPKRLLLLQD